MKEDSIIIYYAGHGHRRKENTSQFPAGDILNEKIHDEYVDFGKLIKRIIYKRADFNLILLDCCNAVVEKNPSPLQELEFESCIPFDISSTLFENYALRFQKLFCLKGFVVASGCSPQECSWYTYTKRKYNNHNFNKLLAAFFKSPSCGGIFSRAFLNSLTHCKNISSSDDTWVSLFDNTKVLSVQETKNIP